jgi:hypothetical protein
MTIQRWFGGRITGLASDTKPTTVPGGTTFVETDTRKKFIFDSTISQWIPEEFPVFKRFRVIRPGSTTYVIDMHGKREGSNNDTQLAIQPILDAMTSNMVYEFVWDAGQWIMTNPINLPTISVLGAVKKVIMKGVVQNWARGTTGYTRLLADVNWPTNRYFFELANPSQLAINGYVEIDNFGATVGNADPLTKNVGFLLLQGGNINLGRFYHQAHNLHLEYMWRGIDVAGMSWFGLFTKIFTAHSASNFTGDASIVIRDGGIVDPAQNPNPKALYFRDLTQSAGAGTQVNYIRIESGGYHQFHNVFVDGKFFTEAVLKLGGESPALGTSKNYFENFTTLDLEYPTPNTTKSSLYIKGSGTVLCYSNTFINCHFTNTPEAILLEGDAVVENRIECVAVWGAQTTRVTDTTAPARRNTIIIFGTGNTAIAPTKITHTGGTSRIIDMRGGAENGGIATGRTDGSTIAHGLFATPAWYFVTGSVAGDIVTATAGTTSLTLAIKKRLDGSAGTSQSVAWRAGVYA